MSCAVKRGTISRVVRSFFALHETFNLYVKTVFGIIAAALVDEVQRFVC